jgi:ribosomal protein S2
LFKKSIFIDFNFYQLFGCNAHIGHHTSKTHSSVFANILGDRNSISIINVAKTIRNLKYGLNVLKKVITNRGRVLFPNIDPRAFLLLSKELKTFCLRYFILNRKIPGVLTNFLVVRKHSKKLRFSKVIPSFTFSLTKYEHHIVHECNILNIPVIGLFDTDTNLLRSTFYGVVSNDDSILIYQFYLKLAFRTMAAGLKRFVFVWRKEHRLKFKSYLKLLIKKLYFSFHVTLPVIKNFYFNKQIKLATNVIKVNSIKLYLIRLLLDKKLNKFLTIGKNLFNLFYRNLQIKIFSLEYFFISYAFYRFLKLNPLHFTFLTEKKQPSLYFLKFIKLAKLRNFSAKRELEITRLKFGKSLII